MNREFRFVICFLFFLSCSLAFSPKAFPQENKSVQPTPPKKLVLVQAVMCERVEEYVPIKPAIVFPTGLEKISCFTVFDPVPELGVVYHNWFFGDKLSTRIKLSIQPPRWSTFSSIQLREADKGPWRVEITGDKGHVFRVLRFSITD